MKLNDIHIRDPFIFAEDGTYYLYGTRAGHPLGPRQGDGLDVYTSKDLVEWLTEIFLHPKFINGRAHIICSQASEA